MVAMKGLFTVRPLNALTNSLKLIIQPQDIETSDSLCGVGFQPVPAIPQLVYRVVARNQVADVFGQICDLLTEASQAASRFLLTRSPLEDSTLLVEFLEAQPLSAITLCVRNAWFFRLLIERRIFFKYQPIFHLASGQVVAHECLARATSDQGKCLTGKHLIDAAVSTQLSCEFDELARAACLESIAALKTEQTFFINVLPNAIIHNPHSLDQNFQQVLDLGLRPQQIIFELTEVEVLDRCPDLPQIVNRLREWGFGIAVDDLCGCVSVDHYVLEFRPDLIKLDRRLVDGCSKHSLKQTLIKSLLHSAHEEGIMVLAEGLEDRSDIEFCRDLGVDYGQGFGLATPELTLQTVRADFTGFAMSKAS
ncbi:EAL domain-containing protein [Kamptonema formosum]|uniref:EAL domain-containing protein n=1 Tax=Kamptonema formosum TaxID=331992 RepID=UPI001E2DC2E8|nr:EAL domain-containing protein [Oscillatoria sp. PCC 10802]